MPNRINYFSALVAVLNLAAAALALYQGQPKLAVLYVSWCVGSAATAFL